MRRRPVGIRAGLPSQLQSLEAELVAARGRAHRLAAGLTAGEWVRRPASDRWSIAEQLTHLNLTSRGYLPVLRQAIDEAREHGITGTGPYRRDFLGWLLAQLAEPPVRLRVRTPTALVPTVVTSPAETLAELDLLQDEVVTCLYRAAGLALDRIETASPFEGCDGRARYNLYSCLKVIPAHQRRHLWLAEQTHAVATDWETSPCHSKPGHPGV